MESSKEFRIDFKTPVFRDNETDNVKDSGIILFLNYIDELRAKGKYVVYFDWSSFSKDIFKKKLGFKKRDRAVVYEQYVYASLHIFQSLVPEELKDLNFLKKRFLGNCVRFLIADY